MNERMTEWAEFAAPTNQWDQVADLLGVNANPADPGQPVQLALAPVQTEIMVAEAEPVVVDPVAVAEEPVVAFAAPVADEVVVDLAQDDSTFADVFVPPVIEADPRPVRTAAPVEDVDYAAVDAGEFIVEDENHYEAVGADEAIAAAAAPEAPVVEMAFAEVPPAAPIAAPTSAPVEMNEQQWLSVLRAARMPVRAEQPAAAAEPVQQATTQSVNGRYVVQLGAFAHSRSLETAWNRALRRNDNLANFSPSRAVFENGRTWHRLSVGGFESRREANRLCRALRGHGQDCFVRARAGDAPLAVAARGGAGVSGRR
jgi:cell division septation protein DedD